MSPRRLMFELIAYMAAGPGVGPHPVRVKPCGLGPAALSQGGSYPLHLSFVSLNQRTWNVPFYPSTVLTLG